MRILVAQGDLRFAERLEAGLADLSYSVDLANDAKQAVDRIDQQDYDAIVVGKMLPGEDTIELCRRLRERGLSTPIMMLSQITEPQTEIEALDAGIDDYVTEPIDFDLLLARVRALFRRCTENEGAVLQYEGIEVDTSTQSVSVDGTPIVVTQREFALLEYFARHRERVVTREALGEHVWGMAFGEPSSNVVDVYVSRLRRKLKEAAKPFIHTVHGIGYMMSTHALGMADVEEAE